MIEYRQQQRCFIMRFLEGVGGPEATEQAWSASLAIDHGAYSHNLNPNAAFFHKSEKVIYFVSLRLFVD